MKIVTDIGLVLPVDDSKVDYENTYVSCIDTVTMISDDVHLKTVWIATCEKDLSKHGGSKEDGFDFAGEEVFNHEPSEDELIHFMCKYGCSLEDLVYVQKGFRLSREYD